MICLQEYEGLVIETSDNTYDPAEDSYLAAQLINEYLDSKQGSLDVIDMGTATGILGLITAKSGKAQSVTFADINKEAVALAKANAKRNNELLKAKVSFIKTNLFKNIEGSFDLMIFNAPYLRNEKKKKALELDGGKNGVELSIKFIDEALPHMKRGARIILVASSLSDLDMLKSHLEKSGLKIYKTAKTHIFFEDIVAYLIG